MSAAGRRLGSVSGTLATLVLAVTLAGCGVWFGEVEDPPLPGERISVMIHQQDLAPDPALSAEPIVLPKPQSNPDWPQAGGYANHAMHHLWVPDVPQQAWRSEAGAAADSYQPRLPPPIAADGRIFVMDAEHRVAAFDAKSGEELWSTELAPEDEEDLITGGIAYDGGGVYATAGFAEVIALNASSGTEAWRVAVDSPIHAPPTVRDGRVFAISLSNTLYALDARTGEQLWTHASIGEIASLIGGANPAVDSDVVVAPFSSGELVAMQVENGNVLWLESLASQRRTDELSNLSQIRAAPVIDRGRVFAIGYGGVMVAVDLRSGRRIWDTNIGGLQNPWVAGNYVYVLTEGRELVCLSRDSGRIHWISQLPAYEDEEEREDPILWAGPVLVGDRLIVAGSNGDVFAVSPYDGRGLGYVELDRKVTVPPIVADGSLYFLSDDATLLAFR